MLHYEGNYSIFRCTKAELAAPPKPLTILRTRDFYWVVLILTAGAPQSLSHCRRTRVSQEVGTDSKKAGH